MKKMSRTVLFVDTNPKKDRIGLFLQSRTLMTMTLTYFASRNSGVTSNEAEEALASCTALSTIKRSSSFLPINTRKLLFNSLVRPHLDYCSVVWHSCNSTISKRIERIQNYGMRVILGKPPHTSSSPLRDQLGWTTLQERRQRFMLTLVYRCLLNLAPSYLKNKFKLNSTLYNMGTRGSGNIHLGQPNSDHYRRSFEYSGALHYNRLPLSSKSCPTLKLFKKPP